MTWLARRSTAWLARRASSESGQMAVELAVLMPVVVVVALVVYNLARFVEACATFDRVAPDAVLTQGVSPAGEQTQLVAREAVRDAIAGALDAPESCEVEVEAESVRASGERSPITVSPLLTRFRCTLVFRPWPSSFVMAGVAFDAPLALRHERTLVVDRYRPGVVM